MTPAVEIEVKGKKFFLKGDHDREYIDRVEKYINERIKEVERAGGPADSSSLMVLVALNLVDDCLKREDEIKKLFPSEFEFTEDMGWIPKGWKVLPLGKICKNIV